VEPYDKSAVTMPFANFDECNLATPHGVAYFTSTCEKMNQYQPILHKMWNDSSTIDKGIWHFNGDLPLSLSDTNGRKLLTTMWLELREVTHSTLLERLLGAVGTNSGFILVECAHGSFLPG
jgi:hypothetical protein